MVVPVDDVDMASVVNAFALGGGLKNRTSVIVEHFFVMVSVEVIECFLHFSFYGRIAKSILIAH